MSQCSHRTEGIGNTILYCIKSKGHALPHEYYAPTPAATDPEAREVMRARIVETLGEHEFAHGPISGRWRCTCGATSTNGSISTNDLTTLAERHAERRAHLADVLLGLWDGDES